MVQPKFCNALKLSAEKGVPVQKERPENWNWGWLWSTYKKPIEFMVYKILHPIFTVWLFYHVVLLIMVQNPGPALVEVSKQFNFTFMIFNLGPGVNYLLWISVIALILSPISHCITCFRALGKDKPNNRFSKLLEPERLSVGLVKCFVHNFVCGLVLLGLYEFCSSPQILSLLCLHTCSGLVAFGYLMTNSEAAKQSPKLNKSSNGITTDAIVPDTSGISVKDSESKGWFRSSSFKALHLVFTAWLNLCVFLLILTTNLVGPAFLEVSKLFVYTNSGSFDIFEPIINLSIWVFVLGLQFDALCHANICFNLLVGNNTQLIMFGEPVETVLLVEWLQGLLALTFAIGVMLLRLCEFYLSPQILSLLILHTCSGLMVLSYYKIQKAALSSSTSKKDSDEVPTLIVTVVA